MTSSTKATLFKSQDPMLQTSVRGHGLISFFRGRFATRDEDLAQAIKDQLLKDPMLRVYIDPNEKEVDLATELNTVNIPASELAALIYEQQIQTQLEESTSAPGNLAPASSRSSVLTGGPSGNARMTAAELTRATSGIKSTVPTNQTTGSSGAADGTKPTV